MAQAALADMQWQPAEDGNFYGSDGYSYQEHLSYLLTDMDQSFSNVALDQGDIPVGNPQNESGFSTHLTVDDQESAFWDRWQDKASGRSAVVKDDEKLNMENEKKKMIIANDCLTFKSLIFGLMFLLLLSTAVSAFMFLGATAFPPQLVGGGELP